MANEPPKLMPQPVDAIQAAFPAGVMHLLPKWSEIPKEFDHWGNNEWVKFVSGWFFEGVQREVLWEPNDGIDLAAAQKHLATIMRSWEPKHEHKIGGVAYLMSLWFKKVPSVPPSGATP